MCGIGSEPAEPTVYPAEHLPLKNDQWTKLAQNILDKTSAKEGYCISWGVGSGRLITALARRSKLHIVAVAKYNVPSLKDLTADQLAKFTARLRLGEISRGIRAPADSTLRFCSGSSPVVPTTSGIPRAAQVEADHSAAGRQSAEVPQVYRCLHGAARQADQRGTRARAVVGESRAVIGREGGHGGES